VTIVCLPGDGIGPEVMHEARRALAVLAPEVELEERPFGAKAIRDTGDPLPQETLAACRAAEAVLKAPIGDPEFDAAEVRPEQGMLRLRAELDVYANLRPAKGDSVDVLIVRELVGGLYFGASGVREDGTAFDTCEYHPSQVERIARRAFELARARKGKLTSVDKANVLETSRLWRRVVNEVAAGYDDVDLEHMLVDNAAMQLAPSASLSDGGPGIFEPVHGSAPDIAGLGIANPAAMLRSTALMLEHGLGRPEEARALAAAVEAALERAPTRDLGGTATTAEFGDAALRALS
jgi:3-isopropylmalate dehydrogenase